MPMTVQGLVSFAAHEPAEVVDIMIPEPGPRDVIVDVNTCGVCHTDLAYRNGDITDDYPFLLGHEATAVVSEIGEDFTPSSLTGAPCAGSAAHAKRASRNTASTPSMPRNR